MSVPFWFWPLLSSPLIGSFINLLVVRLPRGETLIFGRSHCDACGHSLGVWDLIPFCSFVILRGRCRYCAAPIGWLSPSIEFAASALVIWAAVAMHDRNFVATCVLGWILLALGLIDSRDGFLPDGLTLPLLALGLMLTALYVPIQLSNSLIGAVVGYFFIVGLRFFYGRWRRREGIGLGDAKLLAAAGAWVGWFDLPSVVLIASSLALGTVLIDGWRGQKLTRERRIAFGPALCAAFWLVWLYTPLG